MTAIVRGCRGSGRFRAASNRPSAASAALSSSNRIARLPNPRRLERLDVELERALRLEHVHPPVGDDLEPGLRLERRPGPVVAEPHALELRAGVLEREVGVAGGRDRDPPDLALDPQVAQAVVGADAIADRPADLGHRPHTQPERAARDRTRGVGSSGSSGSVSHDGSSQSGGSGVPLMRRAR